MQFLCSAVDYKVTKIKLSPAEALQKIRSWCAYQERSQHETRQKLYSYGILTEEVESIIATLIGENYLNEERFAITLAGGKFRLKKWGRVKLLVELKKHRISERIIDAAIKAIPGKDYEEAINKLIEKKLTGLQAIQDGSMVYGKILRYLISRGYEAEVASEKIRLAIKNRQYEFRSQK